MGNNLFRCNWQKYDNYSGSTVDASAVFTDDTYTYLNIPKKGVYDENSKVRTPKGSMCSELIVTGFLTGSTQTVSYVNATNSMTYDVANYSMVEVQLDSISEPNRPLSVSFMDSDTNTGTISSHELKLSAGESSTALDVSSYQTIKIYTSVTSYSSRNVQAIYKCIFKP